jgi:hypothetical protein
VKLGHYLPKRSIAKFSFFAQTARLYKNPQPKERTTLTGSLVG